MLMVLKSEWERMWGRKKTKVVLLLFFIFLAFECVFLWGMGGRSFYDAERTVELNALNTAPFLLREMAVYMNFILIPMLVVDSFNEEVTSGALRLVLLRPVSHGKLVFAKWFVAALLLFVLNGLMLSVGTLFGRLAMPQVETVTYLNTATYGPLEALLFSVMFYGLAYVIFLAVAGISALISSVLPHPILAYVGIIGFLVGGIYVSSHLDFFFSMSDAIFHQLGGLRGVDMYGVALFCIVLGVIGTVWMWRRRDWTA